MSHFQGYQNTDYNRGFCICNGYSFRLYHGLGISCPHSLFLRRIHDSSLVILCFHHLLSLRNHHILYMRYDPRSGRWKTNEEHRLHGYVCRIHQPPNREKYMPCLRRSREEFHRRLYTHPNSHNHRFPCAAVLGCGCMFQYLHHIRDHPP